VGNHQQITAREAEEMKKNLVVLACVAWAAATISLAAPANAIAITTDSGDYASCSANSNPQTGMACATWGYSYVQTIKFMENSCNSGACQGNATTYTDMVYSAGRKTSTSLQFCGGYNIHGLDTCQC
jgi:hypothetical protein